MFFPAIGVLLTRIFTKEGFKDAWLKPNIKGNIKTYLLAWFGPGVLTFARMLIYFLIFPKNLEVFLKFSPFATKGRTLFKNLIISRQIATPF